MVRLDLDPARGNDGHGDGGDHEPEGEVEEGLLVGEHVQEGGEPGVELVKSLDCALLLPEHIVMRLHEPRVRMDLLGVVVLAPEPILSAVGVFVGHCRYLLEGTGAVLC